MNNNYRYFAVLLFVKKSFDTIEVSGFLKKTLCFKVESPQPFFFRGGPTNNHPPDASHWKSDTGLLWESSFLGNFGEKCLNEDIFFIPKICDWIFVDLMDSTW